MFISEGAEVLKKRSDKVVYRDGERVIKVFGAGKPASDVFNEAMNTSRVHEVGIAVSRSLEVSLVEGGVHEGCWALANSYVPGKTLYDAWLDEPSRFDEYLEAFVDLQLEVQGHRAPLLNRQKEKLTRMISATKGMIDATTRYDLHVRVESMRGDVCVCHGDFIPSNVIEGEDGVLAVCDWSHVTAGTPEVDAAMTYLLFALKYPENAERYLDLYCWKADVDRQVVEWWLPVVAAAELSRGFKNNEEFYKQWVTL